MNTKHRTSEKKNKIMTNTSSNTLLHGMYRNCTAFTRHKYTHIHSVIDKILKKKNTENHFGCSLRRRCVVVILLQVEKKAKKISFDFAILLGIL